MRKSKFKIGDRVRHIEAEKWRKGKVIEVYKYVDPIIVKVNWDDEHEQRHHYERFLEFDENPIERMKRRYEEKK